MLFTLTLKDDRTFSRLYKKGERSGNPVICAYFQKNKSPLSRLGITAGKKVGGAVERNRAKRIIRAAYRKNEKILPIGYDIVIVARPDIRDKKSTDLDPFFKKLSKDMKSREKTA